MAAIDASISLHSYTSEQRFPTKVILVHKTWTVLFRRQTWSRTNCLSFQCSQCLLCLLLFLSTVACSTKTHRSLPSITSLLGSGHLFPCCSEFLLELLYSTWDFFSRLLRKENTWLINAEENTWLINAVLLDNTEHCLQTVATFNQHTCPWFQGTIVICVKRATKFFRLH